MRILHNFITATTLTEDKDKNTTLAEMSYERHYVYFCHVDYNLQKSDLPVYVILSH